MTKKQHWLLFTSEKNTPDLPSHLYKEGRKEVDYLDSIEFYKVKNLT